MTQRKTLKYAIIWGRQLLMPVIWAVWIGDGLISYLWDKIKADVQQSTAYRRSGQCKKRGVCCRHIVVKIPKVAWVIPLYQWIYIAWYRLIYNFQLKATYQPSQALIFRCHYLKGNHCSIYKIRPYQCRVYPQKKIQGPPDLFSGCGYTFTKTS